MARSTLPRDPAEANTQAPAAERPVPGKDDAAASANPLWERVALGTQAKAAGAARSAALESADLSQVRMHPSAAEVTAPLQARAVTQGQDIYFHPGQYRPDTAAGQSLIAHELAHTLQTRQSPDAERGTARTVSAPGDTLEKNADALARGETRHALAAPAGAALRTPFDSESAADRTRREALLQSIGNGTQYVLRLLNTGGIVQGAETPVERGGVRGVIYGTAGSTDESFSSYADRNTRLRRIARFLMEMGTLYRSAPIPADFAAPTRDPTDGSYISTVQHAAGSGYSTSTYSERTPEKADLSAAYERYCLSRGLRPDDYNWDWFYLNTSTPIVPGAAVGAPRTGGGIQSGAYMVFPDVDREPLRYWRLDGFSPTPPGSTIIEFWHDDFGYYYTHRGQRIDVPSPWTR